MQVAKNKIRRRIHGRLLQPTLRLAATFLIPALLTGCHNSSRVAQGQTLQLASSSFPGGQIPVRYTCKGAEVSPQLAWSAPPQGTASLALIMIDPDAPRGTFTHWVLFNLPPATRALPEGLSKIGQLADGSLQGTNSAGEIGYLGPCPPPGPPHHYHFKLYAVNERLNLPAGVTRAQVKTALQGHILARGELVGLFQD